MLKNHLLPRIPSNKTAFINHLTAYCLEASPNPTVQLNTAQRPQPASPHHTVKLNTTQCPQPASPHHTVQLNTTQCPQPASPHHTAQLNTTQRPQPAPLSGTNLTPIGPRVVRTGNHLPRRDALDNHYNSRERRRFLSPVRSPKRDARGYQYNSRGRRHRPDNEYQKQV
jgi:hypothetical protein